MPLDRVTLARALSKLGAASRSEARAWILAGRVAIDGRAASDPDRWIDLRSARLTVDGKPVRSSAPCVLAMHKPVGIVTTRSDERGRPTVYGLLPPDVPRVHPVGRLDLDTSGLLLFTNDHSFGDEITRPDAHVPKTYRVETDAPLTPERRRALESPIVLDDGVRLAPARVTPDRGDARRFTMILFEGKNRQVRRACAAVGLEVTALQRIAIGKLQLGSLAPGACRRLGAAEIALARMR